MKETVHIIALRTIKYNDRHSILSTFSLERGSLSFLVPAGNGREASRRRALLMPLSIVECAADFRPGRDIHTMSDPRLMAPLANLRMSPLKSALTLFIAEVLVSLLRESHADAAMWGFIEDSILTLDALSDSRTANFHICFLCRLGHFLGIAPDTTTFSDGKVFDMIDGTFRASFPSHKEFLVGREAAVVATLFRLSFSDMHLLRLSRSERNAMLDGILRYYSLHIAPLDSLRSLDVLRALF